jgi:hypothetical protein
MKESDLKLLYQLYDNLSGEEEVQFLKTHNLFHASFLSPFPLDMTDKEEQEEILYDELVSTNPLDERINDFINRIDKRIKKEKHRIVLKCDDLDTRYLSDQSFMTVLDETNYGDFLILAKDGSEERNLKLFKERVKNGFDASDLYSLDYTIAKTLLPKMIEKFRDTTHSYPSNISYEEWKEILTKLIWFFNEVLNNYNTPDSEKDSEYNKHLDECTKLFVEYFTTLWD